MLKENRRLKTFISIILLLGVSILYVSSTNAGKDRENNEKAGITVKKASVVTTVAGIGGWLGSGIGYNSTVKLAKVLCEPEEGAGAIAISVSKSRINDFVKNWGGTRKVIGLAAGAAVCGFYAKKYYENFSTHLQSWKKLFI